jgi:hypothetical protein
MALPLRTHQVNPREAGGAHGGELWEVASPGAEMRLRVPHIPEGTTQLFSLAPPPVDIHRHRQREGNE